MLFFRKKYCYNMYNSQGMNVGSKQLYCSTNCIDLDGGEMVKTTILFYKLYYCNMYTSPGIDEKWSKPLTRVFLRFSK